MQRGCQTDSLADIAWYPWLELDRQEEDRTSSERGYWGIPESVPEEMARVEDGAAVRLPYQVTS